MKHVTNTATTRAENTATSSGTSRRPATSSAEPVDTLVLTVDVNGTCFTSTIPARTTLADYLRDTLGLTGTHLGCEQGACGACTVLVDGRSVRSCLMPAGQSTGRQVVTVEALAPPDGPLSRLQEAFARHNALQCGFCTPGMLMAATELLGQPNLDEATIREALSGNLCRCTGYDGVVAAVVEMHRENPPRQSDDHLPDPPISWSPWEPWTEHRAAGPAQVGGPDLIGGSGAERGRRDAASLGSGSTPVGSGAEPGRGITVGPWDQTGTSSDRTGTSRRRRFALRPAALVALALGTVSVGAVAALAAWRRRQGTAPTRRIRP